MALPCGLLDLPVVVPGAVRHDGTGREGVVALLFGLGSQRRCVAEYGLFLEQELFQHERQVVQEVPAVGHLHGVRDALGQGLAVDVRASRAANSTSGCRLSQATRPSCERSGSRATTRWRSRSTSTVP